MLINSQTEITQKLKADDIYYHNLCKAYKSNEPESLKSDDSGSLL